MIITKNIVLKGKHGKPILIDTFYVSNKIPKPILILSHGYKGFKDWGAWNIMAKIFADAGFYFIKFNFSHNGGTAEQPIDFPDLETFGNNNYTKELDDLETVINWVTKNPTLTTEANTNNITLLGHSRGGGIVSIKAEEDSRINNIISLAGVSDFKVRFHENTEGFKQWKKTGNTYVENGRTKQQMPHYFQFYEDFAANEARLTIQRAVKNLKIPHLIIHGSGDTSVSVEEAYTLHKWNPNSKLEIIEGANHVFDSSHPWKKDALSQDLHNAVMLCLSFLKNNTLFN